MLTRIDRRTEEIQRFRAVPAAFQKTFKTPLKDLERFVSTFLAPFELEKAVLSTDEVVFEPKTLIRALGSGSDQADDWYEFVVTAEGQKEISQLLVAALSDWIDFLFVPSPELFAIYADHDEFTTFYSNDHSRLTTLCSGLISSGFEAVPEYMRESSGDKWR
ncbi:MAG TPA: hypothetical protein VNX88_15275 [Terriglobales bacterium]|jgi:hypothetical protein|nr:hypothetical protein [Terriglobales bacterium]